MLFEPDRCPLTWTEPTGVLMTPPLRELVIHLGETSHARPLAEALLFQLLEPAPSNTFPVPLPTDPRIRMIAETLIANQADGRELPAWASHAHTSVRTITRLVSEETGLTFAQWRTRVRIRAALTMLANGRPVGATARALGYRKPAAFSAAFHRVTGQHPSIYLDAG
ncbi:helix-turn-helix transcriptional regulator [Fodinicola acaciae]|uniref:helix-turn-helix transcriptional regulator n=1 Tax=Fodinicola acaciae TaxID=2681555 RepID=UPI0013D5D5A7|nr:helix-turn-helix transcriptional regulator [Fodinicola acaciae]